MSIVKFHSGMSEQVMMKISIYIYPWRISFIYLTKKET